VTDLTSLILPALVVAYLVACSWSARVSGTSLPFAAVLVLVSVAVLGLIAFRVGRVSPGWISAVFTAVAALLTDLNFARLIPLPDLRIYLAAGRHWLDGQPVYQLTPLSAMPVDRSTLPFVYPPPTIPPFGLLAALPFELAAGLFLAGSIAILVLGLRQLGLSWPWVVAVLAWPPVFNAIMSGNVAVALLGLFLIAPKVGSALVVAPIFKAYTAIAALWLVRERRYRDIVVGVVVVAVASLVTLPMVGGLQAWSDWLAALRTFTVTQDSIPSLYGLSLYRYLPLVVVAAIAVLVIVVSLRVSSVQGLARLGIAVIVAQPSLYIHGFAVALPSLLALRTPWLWAALAPTVIAGGPAILPRGEAWPGAWIVVLVVIASWSTSRLRRDEAAPDESPHPLGSGRTAWPEAERVERGARR
jgi:hypothetical protein